MKEKHFCQALDPNFSKVYHGGVIPAGHRRFATIIEDLQGKGPNSDMQASTTRNTHI